MSTPQRQLALNLFVQRFGHHTSAWRHPSSTDNGRPDINWYLNAVRLAEAAKFDAFFMADFIGRSAELVPEAGKNAVSYQFEPFTLLSALATHTKNIGLIATVQHELRPPLQSGAAICLARSHQWRSGRLEYRIVIVAAHLAELRAGR